jgi:hypothetical protein
VVKIRVGNEERDAADVDEHWLCQQINARRRDGQNVCVRVRIETDKLNMILSTPACAAAGGGGRPPTPREQEVLALWDKLHLNSEEYSCGNVNAFLQQLRRLV